MGHNALADSFYIQIQVGGVSAVSADFFKNGPSNLQAFCTRHIHRNTRYGDKCDMRYTKSLVLLWRENSELRGKEHDASTVSLAMLTVLRNNDKMAIYSHLTLHLTVHHQRRPHHGAVILTNR